MKFTVKRDPSGDHTVASSDGREWIVSGDTAYPTIRTADHNRPVSLDDKIGRQIMSAVVESKKKCGELTESEKKYGTFVVDPPWRYGNKSTRNAAAKKYDTMSIEEICDLSVVRDSAAGKSHLYLWVTSSHLPYGFEVMRAWGFEYKSYMVWNKPQMGMGNYFRVSTELVLFGIRGGLCTKRRDLRNNFTENRKRHSQKPPSFADMVMSTSPGPYLEVFSRCLKTLGVEEDCLCTKCRLGWDVWGNQS